MTDSEGFFSIAHEAFVQDAGEKEQDSKKKSAKAFILLYII
jgi:hypothetical protein